MPTTSSVTPPRAILFGVGPLGQRIAASIISRGSPKIVGAIDLAHHGKDLGQVAGVGRNVGIQISSSMHEVLDRTPADIVIHATSSRFENVFPQLEACLTRGLHVVTSCEELSYPYFRFPELSKKLDQLAQSNAATVFATGINPGFLMDKLPMVLTAICSEVNRIVVTRMMYSGTRRGSFQKKIGTGMSPDEFAAKIKTGEITGHVGLIESAAAIADALGWTVDDICEHPVEPVIAGRRVETWIDAKHSEQFTVVEKGQVAGLRSVAEALKDRKAVIRLEFVSHATLDSSYDSILVEGNPTFRQKIEPCIDGDVGTVSMMINAVPRVLNGRRGLLTAKDINPPVLAHQ